MPARVTVKIEGLDEVLKNLDTIGEKAQENLEKKVEELAEDTQTEWRANTHRRSGLLQDSDQVEASGLSFTMNNGVKYYDWVNDGHMTPAGWHRKRGYVPAKRRSHVEGQEMTEKTLEYVVEQAPEKLAEFLDF